MPRRPAVFTISLLRRLERIATKTGYSITMSRGDGFTLYIESGDIKMGIKHMEAKESKVEKNETTI